MRLFTVGPTEMYESTLVEKGKQVPYFRTEEFSKINIENAGMLKQCLGAEESTEIIYLTASGSGAMEAVVMNCFQQTEKVLVIVGGTFGKRFVQICEIHGVPYEAICLESDEELTFEKLQSFAERGFTAMLVNLHETQTGQLYDLEMLGTFCRENNMLFVVDAISTFLCDSYAMEKNGVDVTIISSQKGLCLSPGISMVALSERMKKKIQENKVCSLYFDFKDYIENMKRGQTPFTPAVGIHYELHDMLLRIVEQGVEEHIKEIENRANYFREKIQMLPVTIPDFPLSNAMTPVWFQEEIAEEMADFLRNEKGMIVNPTGGEVGKRSFRVSHMGNLKLCDYDRLVAAMGEWFAMRNNQT